MRALHWLVCVSVLWLANGCATSSGDSVLHLRPKADEVTGEAPSNWTGNFDVIFAVPDLDPVGAVEFKNADTLGFRLNARPKSWYIAPELGYMFTEEQVSGADLQASEFMGGLRIAARLDELPLEFYGSGGVSYLDSTVVDVDDETTGYYAGVGFYLYLGSEEGMTVGGGYRFVDHDWDLEEWGEFQVNVGFAW